MISLSEARSISDRSKIERKIRAAADTGAYSVILRVADATTGTYWQSILVAEGYSVELVTTGTYTTTSLLVKWEY